jgi:SAM-dependent methyltransferase
MSSLPPEETRLWYEDKVRRYGFDHRALGFRTRSSQDKRFEALLQLGDFDGARVLDVGCGFGDFRAFLQERGIDAVYTGIDVCKPMIERCRERFDNDGAIFRVADVMEFDTTDTYDYVLASGLFGLDSEGARDRIVPTLERMFGWAQVGMASNFLSTRTPKPVDGRIYVDPTKALDVGLKLTPAASLNHTYLPNDFTLCLYKTPAWQLEQQSEVET